MLNIENTTPFKQLPLVMAVSAAVIAVPNVMAQETTHASDKVVIVGQENNNDLIKQPSSVKFTQNSIDTPKTINVVTEEVLQDQGVTNLNDALRNVAGVSTFGAGEGGGGNITTSDVVTIRGFDANGSIYVDGIRDVAGYSRDTFNTEQVEVAKGSSSSIYGKGSAGGTVNLVTKKANLTHHKRHINASYDQGNMARFSADVNHVVSDNSAIRLNALISEGGDYLDNGEETYQTLALAPSFYTRISDSTSLTVNLMYMKQNNTPVLGLPTVSEAAATQLGLPEGTIPQSLWSNYYGVRGLDQEKVDTLSTTVIIDHALNDSWAVRSQTRIADNDRRSVITRPRLENTAGRGEPAQYTGDVDLTWTRNELEDSRLFITQLDAIGTINTGTIKHDVVIGTELYKEQKTLPQLAPHYTISHEHVNLLHPANSHIHGTWKTEGHLADIEGKGVAAYIIDTITLNPSWQIGGGLRYEHYKAEGDASIWKRVNNQWVQSSYGTSADDNFLSWHASVNYKPAKNGSVYVAISNAQEPPATDLRFSGWNPKMIEGYNALDPIESTNVEIGTKWSLADDQLLVGAALFRTTRDEYDQNANGQYTRGGEKRTQGVELSIAGRVNDHLSMTATYAYQDSEVTQDTADSSGHSNKGNGLSAAPKNSANIWLNYMAGPWTIGGGIEYNSGNIYWRHGQAFFDTGSTTLANAMAAYEFNDQLRLQLNINNLTDETYVTDYSARGHFKPGTPRNVKLSLNYNF